jgi:hypothetical protein
VITLEFTEAEVHLLLRLISNWGIMKHVNLKKK